MTGPSNDPGAAGSPTPARDPDWRLETDVVTAGRPPKEPDQPLNVPITMASVYVAGGELEYGRYANPTWAAFESALSVLEGGRCLSFASGLAAVDTLLDLMGSDAIVVAPRHCYLGSILQMADREARGRIKARLIDVEEPKALLDACEDAALVWLENPTNPALEVIDVAEVAAAAHANGAYVVVDNTFATPVLQRPLELGADVVLHSATKYLAGHADAVLGALVTRDDELFSVLKQRRDMIGAIPGTLEAWLALRGLRTLSLRVERAQANAQVLAERLAAHPAVADVRYPGFGAVISFEPTAGAMAADLITHSTRIWVHATSLGGVESSLERRRRWKGEAPTIPEALIRMSVGIEHVDDLWADLVQAIEQTTTSTPPVEGDPA